MIRWVQKWCWKALVTIDDSLIIFMVTTMSMKWGFSLSHLLWCVEEKKSFWDDDWWVIIHHKKGCWLEYCVVLPFLQNQRVSHIFNTVVQYAIIILSWKGYIINISCNKASSIVYIPMRMTNILCVITQQKNSPNTSSKRRTLTWCLSMYSNTFQNPSCCCLNSLEISLALLMCTHNRLFKLGIETYVSSKVP